MSERLLSTDVDWTTLLLAAATGHIEYVKLLLDHGAINANVTDSNGQTALFAAAGNGHVEVVQILLDCGADVNLTDNSGQTALFNAAKWGHVAVVRLLLDRGADVNLTDNRGRIALFDAARRGCVGVVRVLLDRGALVNLTDGWGQTALFDVAGEGRAEVVRVLLDRGAHVNLTDSSGQTVLFAAAKQGHVEVVQVLLDHGADVNLTDSNGQTALFGVASEGDEVVRLLLDRGADVNLTDGSGQTALFAAAGKGHVEVVQVLLDPGASVNLTDSTGQTALFAAAENYHVKVVRLLLDRGADVNLTDSSGQSALFCAAENGHVAVVRLLLDRGADVNLTDSSDQSALFCAAENGHVAVVRLLLDRGADVNLTDSSGQTALFCAAENGHVAVVQLLLDRGADVNLTDSSGQSALFCAAENGHVAVVRLLLDRGADVNLTDSSDQTALFGVASRGDVEVVRLLLDHSADVNLIDSNGKTALSAAARKGQNEVLHLLLEHGTDPNVIRTLLCAAVAHGNFGVIWILRNHIAYIGFSKVEAYYVEHKIELKTTVDQTCMLYLAALHGSVRFVEILLHLGADVNAHVVDEHGQTALFAAAVGGNVEVVEVLLKHGADVNVADASGQTALFVAADKGNVEVVGTLLNHGADVKITDAFGKTVFTVALEMRNMAVVLVLLNHGLKSESMPPGEECMSALNLASKFGSTDVIQILLDCGMDVNAVNENGRSALFCSCQSGTVQTVRMLLNHGADTSITDWHGQTTLFPACRGGSTEVLKELLEKGVNHDARDHQGQNALFLVAQRGTAAMARLLINQQGFSINATNLAGQTALFAAAGCDNVEVVQVLLDAGIQQDAVDQHGRTALFPAASYDCVNVAKVLLVRGVNANTKDKFRKSALFYAVEKGNLAVIGALLAPEGTDVNSIDGKGQTALFAGVQRNSAEVVEILLEHGAEVNINDNRGQTVLFFAVQNGNCIIIDLLLKRSADLNMVDVTGSSALFKIAVLITGGTVSPDVVIQIMELLWKHEANFEIRNKAGETLLLHILTHSRKVGAKSGSLRSLEVVCRHLVCNVKVDVSVKTFEQEYSVIHLLLLLLRDFLKGATQQRMVRTDGVSSLKAVECLLGLIQPITSASSFTKSVVAGRSLIDGNTPLHLWASLPYHRLALSLDDYVVGCKEVCPLEIVLVEVAEQLLSNGAQVCVGKSNGETPLHMAESWNAAQWLLNKGALPNGRDCCGNTPLLSSLKKGQVFHESYESSAVYHGMSDKSLKEQWETFFNKYVMDPWKANEEGTTILSLLVQCAGGYEVVIAFLEATGAPYGLQYPIDSNGDTPLHVICRDGRTSFLKLSVVDFLVTSGPHLVNQANRCGETAMHILCQKEYADQLTCGLVQRLHTHGADVDIADGRMQTCLDITVEKPKLRKLLMEDISLFKADPLLPWVSKSSAHKGLLAQVACIQHSRQTGTIHYHRRPIGSGAFGHVYAGIDEKDGREVAVKRIEREKLCQHQDRREISSLVNLADCHHVVSYHGYHMRSDFLYIVLELMEGTVNELLNMTVKKADLPSLCQDVLKGLKFLHQDLPNCIIHRDIKPSNILYKQSSNREICLKLADFGLSLNTGTQTTTVMHSTAGTRCWMAPELLKSTMAHSPASDIFACGLVLHHILSNKQHPFRPTQRPEELGILLFESKIVSNIDNNELSIAADLSSEATNLVKLMVNQAKGERPSAAEALQHPLFWPNSKKINLLCAVANQPEIQRPRFHVFPLSGVELDLESCLSAQFSTNPWNGFVPQIFPEMTKSRKSRKYVTSSAVDLLRFVRNTHEHIAGECAKPGVASSVLEDYMLLSKFPTLLMIVYEAVKRHGWDKRGQIALALSGD